ncbi:hypothetical protein GALL_109280 [mine drainage metagenome]|uniref:Methyltransferase FkbM domain-containing protein n=1 Tax=mine drainage metagenome TaxID=410659 RepID=A0A1J5SSM5_9ZZZZ
MTYLKKQLIYLKEKFDFFIKIKRAYFFYKNPGIKSMNLTLHPEGEFLSDEIRTSKTYYEIDLLIFMYNNYDCQRFCDIGANIGNHSNFFERLGSKGWAIEPFSNNFTLLKLNAPTFQLFNLALSDKSGIEKFVTYESCFGNGNLISNFDNKIQNFGTGPIFENVRVEKLDNLGIENPTIIKIDVEGAELKVLRGAEQTLLKYKPVICIELHSDKILKKDGFNYSRKDIIDFLFSLGYKKTISFDSRNHFFEKNN